MFCLNPEEAVLLPGLLFIRKAVATCPPPTTQDEPPGKAFFALLGGLACDLEGVGAGARQFSTFKISNFLIL
ncbi:hypothetical protein AF332_19365 [Sporosarcina globispora]|uniref:Uncharacterized protein n=1 Tax=Sporosarcina globispora TaxID=1459 RepID=A0A0M0GFP9_SPOGL|nr:hypothetical protein AF332_19365 [Sporosarcina globispora]